MVIYGAGCPATFQLTKGWLFQGVQLHASHTRGGHRRRARIALPGGAALVHLLTKHGIAVVHVLTYRLGKKTAAAQQERASQSSADRGWPALWPADLG